MTTLEYSTRNRGGLAATFELYADGHSRPDIAEAVSLGSLIRVRQGWYCLPEVHPLLREAARVGGPATCSSGLRLQSIWTMPSPVLHVAVRPTASRLRSRRDKRVRLVDAAVPQVRIHWTDEPRHRLLLTPIDCLADLIQCETPERVTAIADSVLHRHPLLIEPWLGLVRASPATLTPWLLRVDGVCESGTESIFWFRMSPLGIPITRQKRIPGIGRVDFVIGLKLVIEVDSVAYHTDPDAYERDRRRDARLSARGYRVLRFTYDQILNRWYEVEAAVFASLARGDHR
jgi:very-short-patch-repair endonuclease